VTCWTAHQLFAIQLPTTSKHSIPSRMHATLPAQHMQGRRALLVGAQQLLVTNGHSSQLRRCRCGCCTLHHRTCSLYSPESRPHKLLRSSTEGQNKHRFIPFPRVHFNMLSHASSYPSHHAKSLPRARQAVHNAHWLCDIKQACLGRVWRGSPLSLASSFAADRGGSATSQPRLLP
jgi:hypothetical protein